MYGVKDFFDLAEFPFAGVFEGIENVWEALAAIKPFLSGFTDWKIECEIPGGAWLENRDRIAIGPDTVIENGATVIGPAVIGAGCTVRQGAYIRGTLIAGNGCVIGHTTEVKNSIFLNGAKAAHFAYVGDSILGAGVNLGAGTKLANFKIDTGDRGIQIEAAGRRIETGLRKLGAILGDGVEIGCNSVTMPGTLVGPHTLIYPNAVVRGLIAADRVIKIRQQHEITERRNPGGRA